MAITLTYPDGGTLVTGGTGRVGEAVVRRMAEAGAPLVFTYRGNEEAARKLETELRAADRQVTAARLDMTDAASIRAAVELTERQCGPLKTVICGSGVMVEFNKMADFPIEQVEQFVNGDALGYYRIFHETIPALRANGGGSITTCSTMATKRVVDYDGISPFSKGAVDALVRQIAAEEAENEIRCNAVAIGWVEYTSVEESRARFPKPAGAPADDLERIGFMMHQITGQARRGRPVTPAEAANTFAYLASDQAAHLTGQCITLDAGFLL
jgi:NAD(P)-dependent dehydrogenase (short-subunit alcohol dehydrogenase family)